MKDTTHDRRIAGKANRALDAARNDARKLGYSVENHIEGIHLNCVGYAEPGYDTKTGIVALGNWNNVDTYDRETKTRVDVSDLPERLGAVFEKLGIECEWSDEWSECSDCNRIVRTSGDSYHWQPSFALVDDCELVCADCLAENADSHLESLEGNERACNTIATIDPAGHGYVLVNKDSSYETGWHPGQNDSPAKIADDMRAKGISRFLFQLDENSQFYSRWSLYVHESESHLIDGTGAVVES